MWGMCVRVHVPLIVCLLYSRLPYCLSHRTTLPHTLLSVLVACCILLIGLWKLQRGHIEGGFLVFYVRVCCHDCEILALGFFLHQLASLLIHFIYLFFYNLNNALINDTRKSGNVSVMDTRKLLETISGSPPDCGESAFIFTSGFVPRGQLRLHNERELYRRPIWALTLIIPRPFIE